MIKFFRGYNEGEKRINEGTVNNKNYKIYLNTKTGDTVDILGNLNVKDLGEINKYIENSVTKSEQEYGG